MTASLKRGDWVSIDPVLDSLAARSDWQVQEVFDTHVKLWCTVGGYINRPASWLSLAPRPWPGEEM